MEFFLAVQFFFFFGWARAPLGVAVELPTIHLINGVAIAGWRTLWKVAEKWAERIGRGGGWSKSYTSFLLSPKGRWSGRTHPGAGVPGAFSICLVNGLKNALGVGGGGFEGGGKVWMNLSTYRWSHRAGGGSPTLKSVFPPNRLFRFTLTHDCLFDKFWLLQSYERFASGTDHPVYAAEGEGGGWVWWLFLDRGNPQNTPVHYEVR